MSLAVPCNSNPVWAQRAGSHPWMMTCGCNCWMALLFVASSNSHGVDAESILNKASIRSSSPAGTTLSIPVHHLTYLVGGVAHTTAFSVDIVVGTTTSGWEFLTTKTENGATFYVFWNALSPSPSSHYCDPPMYGLPTNCKKIASSVENPGLVKLRDLGALMDSIMGVIHNSLIDNSWLEAMEPSPGVLSTLQLETFCDPPLVPGESLYGGGSVPSNCGLIALGGALHVLQVWAKAVYSTPANCTTDEAFDVTVSFFNPFTGNAVDGSHVYGDAQEADVDCVPNIEMANQLASDEFVSHGSITRTSYGVYVIHGCKCLAVAGSRKVAVYPQSEFTSFNLIPHFRVNSGSFTLSPGVPACVDFPPANNVTFDPEVWQIGETMLRAGAALRARILDAVGQFRTYNVVPTAINVVDVDLHDLGSNAISSPTLGGTTSQAAVAGIASFDDLAAHALGRNYDLRISGAGLSQATNDNWFEFPVQFYVGFRFHSPGPISAGVSTTIFVDLVDAQGNIVAPDVVDVLTLAGAGSFSGFGNQSPVLGTASWTGTFPAPGTYLINVVTSGTTYDGPPTTVTLVVTVS